MNNRLNTIARYIGSCPGHLKIYIIILSGICLLATGCSTTKNLPEGEVLYTGLKKTEVTEEDHSQAGDEALREAEASLRYPPNNALLGSSSIRFPLPIGLWIYNGFVNKKGKVGQWIFKRFAAKPVYISTVNPELRAKVAHNVLRENGYFNNYTDYEVIPDPKNERKASIRYYLEMNNPYLYDSIQYVHLRHRIDTIIEASKDKRLIHKGDHFNASNLEAERKRVSDTLRNNGYYYFRPELLIYHADTTMVPGKVQLRLTRQDGVARTALRPWYIGDISIRLNGFYNEPVTDSIRYKDMTIYYEGKLRVRPGVLYNRLKFRTGDLYTQDKQDKTQKAFNQLGIFRFADTEFHPKDTTRRNNLLDLRINTIYDLPLDGEFEGNVTTKSNNQTGPGAIFSVTRRNIFRGGETFNVQLKGSYEWQTGRRVGNNNSAVNSYEIGINTSLAIPKILFPGFIHREYDYPSSTTFKLYADLLNRAGYFRMLSFGGNASFDWQPTAVSRHSLTVFRLTYNLLQSTTAAFDTITAANRPLYLSLQNQFIPGMGYTYTYDDYSITTRRNHFWFQASASQAGNIIDGIYAIAGKKFNEEGKKLFGNPFAQFVKATAEVRYNYKLNRNQNLVARFLTGFIYSYGNARVSPFSEQFYIGGANSIRAFTIRTIGPGSFVPAANTQFAYLDQTGDWKVEANLEYRFKILGDLHGATFIDTGNIWLLREDVTRPGGKLGNFFKELALGTGAGLRYDLTFLVVRLD
ncbi:MAG: BamA/TamA family outer membrane protein, partial [Tannerellaceae bacterium]|nr:BamA/TamA family outer membrane protein [Tannerellaceae bacterium]